MPRSELFIGNLVTDVQNRDVEEVFDKYGRIIKCEVKNKGPGSSFCFVEYEDERDAEEAMRGENGRDLLGNPMVVEWAKGKQDRRGDDRFGGRGGFRGDDRRDGGRGGFRGGPGGRECYNCGEPGHFARECRSGGGRGGGGDRDRGRYGAPDSGRYGGSDGGRYGGSDGGRYGGPDGGRYGGPDGGRYGGQDGGRYGGYDGGRRRSRSRSHS